MMEWTHVLGIILGNAAWMMPLFFWNRSESRADARHYDAETKHLRRELIDVVRAMQEESKDFHARLCVIESRKEKK